MSKQDFNARGILAGEAPKDTPITVSGWVRTRRDSKAGISFVQVSDGSTFHPVQVVVPNTLVQLCRRGSEAHGGLRGARDGHDRAVACQGPAVRDAGDRGRGGRLGRRPRHLSDLAQSAHARISARGRASAAAHQCDRGGDARATFAREGDPPLLRRGRILLGQHADHHLVRRGRRGRDVPRLDARLREPAAHQRGRGRFQPRLLRPRRVPHRVGPAQRRGLLSRDVEGLHFRADLPRRELQHQPPSRRILDDRAGDRLRRSRRRCDAG